MFGKYLTEGMVNGYSMKILRDTGATIDVVAQKYVTPHMYTGETVWIQQALEVRDRFLPIAEVEVIGEFGRVFGKAVVVQNDLDRGVYILGNTTAELIEKCQLEQQEKHWINTVQTRAAKRRGERQSRFQPRSSSGGRDRDRGGRRAPADRRIYISNIPYEFRWQELKDLFRTEVGEVAYVELFSDDGEKPRGCGIVEFENAESVKKAVEKMHRWELKGRKLVVKEDFDIERDKYGRPMKGGSSGGGGGRGNAGMSGGSSRPRDEPRFSWQAPAPTSPAIQNKWGNTYGLSPQFLECLGINGPLVSRLFVANLDYKVDEKKLRDVFRLAGKVTNAKLNRDKDGKSRGHGVVKFEHPVEAVQAISMLHNQLLYDRKITVRMDRVNEKTEGLPSKLPDGLRGIGMGLGAGGNPLLDVSRAAVLPSVVSPSLGLNSTGRFADSPPLPRRSALGYSSGAVALSGGLSVGVGSLGALAGGGDIGSIGGSLGCSLGAGLAGVSS
ncbi:myelin expression factor 2-like [Ischnura elegans]|uniref:myelin expression factor 2-like n=1 Tax=Ischnura elegans TaxID=197161 RepID=UPI001ED89604|nr:myelin expression factor 2-like [Ischnura elegans]